MRLYGAGAFYYSMAGLFARITGCAHLSTVLLFICAIRRFLCAETKNPAEAGFLWVGCADYWICTTTTPLGGGSTA